MQAIEVRRVQSSADLSSPGDFTFVPKREPVRKFERIPLEAPKGYFRNLLWQVFGKKYEVKQIVELLWPEYDAVILNCPNCNMPLATTPQHKIVSLDPLTIETPIACSYERSQGIAAKPDGKSIAFQVKEGKIIAV
ncbi:MAG TPA: hypothetical protein VNJ52_05040 [Patescibacteria group bacterium]|nr:hypothetical protein [Patescibacteria group bacterium]